MPLNKNQNRIFGISVREQQADGFSSDIEIGKMVTETTLH